MSPRRTLILILAILALYLPVIGFDFAYDDFTAIVQNPDLLQHESPLQALGQIFSSPYRPGMLYRPMVVFSYFVNSRLSGFNPASFHAVNLLLHICCVLLVFKVVRPLVANDALAYVSAFLFAIHPINVEAVSNIVGRAELLAAAFGLCCLLLLRRWQDQGGVALLVIAGFSFLGAALSKESAFCLLALGPAYLVFLDRRRGGPALARTRWRTVVPLLVLVVAALTALALRRVALGGILPPSYAPGIYAAANPLLGIGFVGRIIPGIESLGRYLCLLVYPLNLSADYSLPEGVFWSEVYSMWGISRALVCLAFAAAGIVLRRHRWSFGVLWFFLAFSLTANIFTPIGTIAGERLGYFPSIGAGVFLVGLVDEFLRRTSLKPLFENSTTTALILGLFFLRAMERVPVWKDNLSLFGATVLDAPQSPKASFNLGLELYKSGRDPILAESFFRRAYSLMPTNPETSKLILELTIRRADFAAAELWAHRALELAPSDIDTQAKLEALRKLRRELQAKQAQPDVE